MLRLPSYSFRERERESAIWRNQNFEQRYCSNHAQSATKDKIFKSYKQFHRNEREYYNGTEIGIDEPGSNP